MPQKHLPTALTVTAFLTLLKCVHVEYPDIVFQTPDIRKLVGTREPIWTFYEKGGSRVDCKVDVMLTINARSVYFRRMYIHGGKKYANNLWGLFDNVYKERMQIWPAGPTFYQIEQVTFMPRDHSCAVVMTTLIGTHVIIAPIRWYELRVRNSALATGPHQKCLREFKNVLYRKRLVYTPDCQRMLAYAPYADGQ
uniref:Lipocalin n=1 Tax=Rhipicephalus appendiculatus TaxID=34631 RepID=A0A131YPT7_RHIAP